MAGRTWIVVDADPEQSELLVAPVSDQGHAPQWVGELPPTPAEVALGKQAACADSLQLIWV